MQNPPELEPDEIRSFRQFLGLSQAALGEALGSSARTVEDWEAGRRRAPAMLALAFAAIAENLPLGLEATKIRQSTRRSIDLSLLDISKYTNTDVGIMTEDERYIWSKEVQELLREVTGDFYKLNIDSKYHKFQIYRDKAGEFRVRFYYKSQIIFSTEGYSEFSGASRAVEIIKSRAASAPTLSFGSLRNGHHFEIYTDKAGTFRVRFKYNSEVIFSTEGYDTISDAVRTVSLIKRYVGEAEVDHSVPTR